MIRQSVVIDAGTLATRTVDANIFIPGVSRHLSMFTPGTVQLTHIASGITLLDGIPPAGAIMEIVLPEMRVYRWTRDISEIMHDTSALELLMRVKRKLGLEDETQLAKLLGMQAVPGSGSRPNNKRDMRDDVFLLELKTTAAAHYSIDVSDMAFLDSQAAKSGKEPAYAVKFMPNTAGAPGGILVMFKESTFPDVPLDTAGLSITGNSLRLPATLADGIKPAVGIPVTLAGKHLYTVVSVWLARDLIKSLR